MKFIAGIDEAGRGPVIGPMVVAIVACTPAMKQLFNKIGVKDSKQLSPAKRVKLARIIKKTAPHKISILNPKRIDLHVRDSASSLTTLEAVTSASLINRINKDTPLQKVIIDLPSNNKETYCDLLREQLIEKKTLLQAEFKADEHHVEVAAASILAKVTRDKAIQSIQKKCSGPIGSGYPADPATKQALLDRFEELNNCQALRQSWKTVKRIIDASRQKPLTDFAKK